MLHKLMKVIWSGLVCRGAHGGVHVAVVLGVVGSCENISLVQLSKPYPPNIVGMPEGPGKHHPLFGPSPLHLHRLLPPTHCSSAPSSPGALRKLVHWALTAATETFLLMWLTTMDLSPSSLSPYLSCHAGVLPPELSW